MPQGVYIRKKKPEWAMRFCATCEQEFIPIGAAQKYCPPCKVKIKKEWQRKGSRRYRAKGSELDSCPDCGGQKYKVSLRCSSCRYIYRREHPETYHRESKGFLHKGYKVFKINGHHVPEHRLIWEQIHKKTLPSGWLIHHLNGIRLDNRPENLVAMPRKEHENHTLLRLAQKRIRELEQLHLFVTPV